MKGKSVLLVAVFAVVAATPAFANYTSIVHNLLNNQNDTSFNHLTGEFSIDSTATNQILLNDPAALAGTIVASHVELTTTFDSVEIVQGTPRGKFIGGSFSLTFDFDPGAPGPIDGGVDSFEISGPITALWFSVSQLGTFGRLDGLGRWTASLVDLPGSGVWPAATFSSIDSLSISFNDNLSGFDWTEDDLTGRVESQYSLFPSDAAIPEPTSVALLVLGGLGVLRRRR